jgi:putative transposase
VVGYLRWMMPFREPIYAGCRHPTELISYAVWLYFRFPLSLSMIEEILAAGGISVTYEAIRQRDVRFGREFVNRIRRRALCRGDEWHFDEVVITIVARSTGCGVRSTRRASFSMSSSKAGATRRPPTLVPQAPEEAGASASGADHRQAAQLRCRQAGDHARRRASAAQRPQQPGGEFPPTNTTTRAVYEAFQVAAAGATFSFRP